MARRKASKDGPHPVDIYVGRRLRLKRTIQGLSQEYIGKAIGVTFQQIQKYERGVNRMGSSRLYEFGRLLSVPVAYFFEGFETSEGADFPTPQHGMAGMAESAAPGFEHEKLTSRETLEMMRAYYRINDPSVRKSVYELVKSIADQHSKLSTKKA